MDWKQFISSIIGSLAWPAVVAYLLYLLRAQLGSLAARLTELTLPGGTKALFSAELIAAKDEALILAARSESTVLPATERRDEFHGAAEKSTFEGAGRSARQRITQKSVDVAEHIRRRIAEAPLQLRQEPYDFVFNVLYQQDGEKELYNTFTRIREISSVAYNSSETSIRMPDANSYDDICTVFIASFDKAFDAWLARVS